jgi:hypothetical protein
MIVCAIEWQVHTNLLHAKGLLGGWLGSMPVRHATAALVDFENIDRMNGESVSISLPMDFIFN